MYKDVLGRDFPDREGVTWWVTQLATGKMQKENFEATMYGAAADWEETSPGVWKKIGTGTTTPGTARDDADMGVSNPAVYAVDDYEQEPINFDDIEMDLPETPTSPSPTLPRSQFETFIRNVYKAQFERYNPEQSGVDYWVDELVSGRHTYNSVRQAMYDESVNWEKTDVPGEYYHEGRDEYAYDEVPPVEETIEPVTPPTDPLPDMDVPDQPDIPIEETFEPPIDLGIPDWLKDWEPPDFSEFLKPREFTFDKTRPQQAATLYAPVIGGEREDERKRRASAKSRFKVPLATGVQI
jgi:hypothetical protein